MTYINYYKSLEERQVKNLPELAGMAWSYRELKRYMRKYPENENYEYWAKKVESIVDRTYDLGFDTEWLEWGTGY